MDVWDPGEETTVFSQIKKLINAWYRALRVWMVRLDPGNLVFLVKDRFYAICEHGGSKISNYGWHKRWNKRNRKRYKHG